MKVIVVYDIKEKRVSKVLKICRKYFTWIQNSVFEGEITASKLEKFKIEINGTIKKDEDSVIIYVFPNDWYSKREIIGIKKGGEELIL